MFNPLDSERYDSFSSSSPPITEPSKHQECSSMQNRESAESPHSLLLLLHQRDLEIKGLKSAAQKEQSNRLNWILQELVRPRQKGPPKKSPVEIALRKEVDQLNDELKAVKCDHKKEIQELENHLTKSRLHALQLEQAVRTLSAKSDSTISEDRSKVANEIFELWSEAGSKITSDTSDLRLRRIPKHTSFVDAFHKFGSVTLSDEDKKEIINKLEAYALKAQSSGTTDESSTESSSQLPSEQSSLAIVSSHKSDLTSSVYETKTTESSLSLPSGVEKTHLEKVHTLDQWSLAQAGLTLGQLSDGEKIPPSTEICKRSLSVKTAPLKIVQVHRKGKFVRILNSLLNKEVDLSGYSIQQWVGGYPVSIYRFPNGTILPAQHHITVWAAAANLAHEKPSDELSGPRFFKADPGCVTVLYNRRGQMVSQHANAHQFTTAAEAYSDNLDLSVDKFPLKDDDEQYDESMPSRELDSHHSKHLRSGLLFKRRYTRHLSIDTSATSKTPLGCPIGSKAKIRELNKEAPGSFSSKSQSSAVSESPSSSSEGDYFAFRSWKPIIREPETREFKTTLDTTLPMVSLIGQKSARSKYGFKKMLIIITSITYIEECPVYCNDQNIECVAKMVVCVWSRDGMGTQQFPDGDKI
ncbi:lamin tail domain-containing protein 2 [Sceloporus undulatus]|uniref:lamin tail domain-containing protein 2 n=1 Tax=Sceloporus undulatus TaxID=8520 RepID=UPI001C4D2913|nr:lamin tail domain-containing protein 2 [Sceloporus undulatus]